MNNINKYISLIEWADREGLDHSNARRKAREGKIKSAVKVGRNWMVHEDEKDVDHRFVHKLTKKEIEELKEKEGDFWFLQIGHQPHMDDGVRDAKIVVTHHQNKRMSIGQYSGEWKLIFYSKKYPNMYNYYPYMEEVGDFSSTPEKTLAWCDAKRRIVQNIYVFEQDGKSYITTDRYFPFGDLAASGLAFYDGQSLEDNDLPDYTDEETDILLLQLERELKEANVCLNQTYWTFMLIDPQDSDLFATHLFRNESFFRNKEDLLEKIEEVKEAYKEFYNFEVVFRDDSYID